MDSIYTIILLIVISVFITLFSITGLIVLWIMIYNKFFKESLYNFKKVKIKRKLNEINEWPEIKKIAHEKEIKKYSDFIDRDILKNETSISLETIELTERIKSLIDVMIEVEIYGTLRQYFTLNTKYDILNLDRDIESISTKIFTNLNPSVLNSELFFSYKYIMSYVINQTYNLLLHLVTDHNSSIITQ